MGPTLLCNVTNGHMEVEQAPFAPAITRCYFMSIITIDHDLSQELDLEAVGIVARSLLNQLEGKQ